MKIKIGDIIIKCKSRRSYIIIDILKKSDNGKMYSVATANNNIIDTDDHVEAIILYHEGNIRNKLVFVEDLVNYNMKRK